VSLVATETDARLAAFVSEHGLSLALRTTERLIRQSFPGLQKLRASLVADPEIPNEEHVRLQAFVTGSVDEVLEWEERFDRAYAEAVGPDDAYYLSITVEITDFCRLG
jgi:hypothetical protein